MKIAIDTTMDLTFVNEEIQTMYSIMRKIVGDKSIGFKKDSISLDEDEKELIELLDNTLTEYLYPTEEIDEE